MFGIILIWTIRILNFQFLFYCQYTIPDAGHSLKASGALNYISTFYSVLYDSITKYVLIYFWHTKQFSIFFRGNQLCVTCTHCPLHLPSASVFKWAFNLSLVTKDWTTRTLVKKGLNSGDPEELSVSVPLTVFSSTFALKCRLLNWTTDAQCFALVTRDSNFVFYFILHPFLQINRLVLYDSITKYVLIYFWHTKQFSIEQQTHNVLP
jgi:hypothetical protein